MKRTALLLRCSEEEANLIRDAAKHERRTVSAYIVHAVMSRLRNREKLVENMPETLQERFSETRTLK
jgi:uncharacterized protein (DUF1778 family)